LLPSGSCGRGGAAVQGTLSRAFGGLRALGRVGVALAGARKCIDNSGRGADVPWSLGRCWSVWLMFGMCRVVLSFGGR